MTFHNKKIFILWRTGLDLEDLHETELFSSRNAGIDDTFPSKQQDNLILEGIRMIKTTGKYLSSMALKLINIRWIITGSKPYWKIIYCIVL